MVFDKRYFIGFFISVIFIGIMAAVSDLIGVTEVIFPEAAALLFGSFIMIRMPWNVRHVTMTAEMTACAAAGLIISRYADKNVLIVSHGGVCRIIETYFHEMTTEQFLGWFMGNCQIIEYNTNGGRL